MSTATYEAVAVWMRATGHGARRAAKHFDIPLGTANSWHRRAKGAGLLDGADRQPASAPTPPVPNELEQLAVDLSTLDGPEFYERLTRTLGETLAKSAAKGHGSAASQCTRQLLAVRAAAQAEAATLPDEDDLTKEEYLAELELAVAGWPEDFFDVVFRVYEGLRRCQIVKVHEGGQE